ncbi:MULTISPECIES: DUF2844 domain-containing protein [Paraburkholderia]|uniref:DUF2844 domain-containing protein n=2 Tax=Paraburkholderia TaxID=1822464 RepID=A0A7Y9WKG5_9BURK|nr:DUF2844 domain-containing protein [Paraburkholderia bryophila]NYH22277.1 hypothetical protein [Paraburkholderia bryophila]
MKLVKAALAASAFWPLASYAVLGGSPGANTGVTARSMLQAAAPRNASAAAASYTMRESEDADGVTIHEYALPTNVVFAVSWQGPVRPDMRALLGSYFPNFANGGASQTRGAGPMVEHSGDFHLESAGRAGHFFGKAYLPRLVPANVRVDQLP